MSKQTRLKIISVFVSILLVILIVSLFILDSSLEWGKEKIISLVICSIWTFFLTPTILYYVYKMKNSGLEYSTRLKIEIGAKGFIGLIIAPYYGIKAYLVDLDNVRYNGEIFL